MDTIVRRIRESFNLHRLDDTIFDIEPGSNEAYDLLDELTHTVYRVVRDYDPGIDLDDNNLDHGRLGDGDRTMVFTMLLYRYTPQKNMPLKRAEMTIIENELSKLIKIVPDEIEAGAYDFSVVVSISGLKLSILLRREEKL